MTVKLSIGRARGFVALALAALTSSAALAQVPSFGQHNTDTMFPLAWSNNLFDLDGDGDLDQLAASQSGEAAWYENDGGDPNTWVRRVIQANNDASGHWWQCWSIFAADMDNDGDLDVVGGTGGPPGPNMEMYEINWWENDNGDGTVWTRHIIDVEDRSISPQRLITLYWAEPGDINNDGLMDVAIANYDSIEWAEHSYDSVTQTHSWTIHTLDDGDCRGAHAARPINLDSDPDLEIVGAAYYEINPGVTSDGGVAVYGLTTGKLILADDMPGAFSVDFGDFDGDGDLDVVGTGGDSLRVWENSATWNETTVGSGGYSVVVGDIDNDGIADLVTGGQDIDVYLGTGSMTSWTHGVAVQNVGSTSLALGDYNNDGDQDIGCIPMAYSMDVLLFEQGGTGSGGGGYGGYGGGYGGP